MMNAKELRRFTDSQLVNMTDRHREAVLQAMNEKLHEAALLGKYALGIEIGLEMLTKLKCPLPAAPALFNIVLSTLKEHGYICQVPEDRENFVWVTWS